MLYPEETIQSQYAASPTINALVSCYNDGVDPRADINLFYANAFDPGTARGVGLDIWGRIVAMTRELNVVDTRENFGFDYAVMTTAAKREPFDQGVFYQKPETSSGVQRIEDSAFRRLIMWKAKANISGTSLHDIEECLAELLSVKTSGSEADNRVIVQDDGPMKIKVTLSKEPTPFQYAVMTLYQSLFVGAGVGVEVLVLDDTETAQALELSTDE